MDHYHKLALHFIRRCWTTSHRNKITPQIYPRPGWVEHDPLEILERTQEVVLAAVAKSGYSSTDLAAIGITNQRETTVVWDRRTGQPYTNAIVWQDTRTAEVCTQLAADGGQNLSAKRPACRWQPIFGPKLRRYWKTPRERSDAERVTPYLAH